jgi:hypothetical protein
MVVDHSGRRCAEPTGSGGTGGMFPPGLARRSRQGIELLPRDPATESGTARRRGSTRCAPACWGVAQRLGDEVAGTGAEERVDRKRHRYRPPEGPLRLILARALHLCVATLCGPGQPRNVRRVPDAGGRDRGRSPSGGVHPQEWRSTVGISARSVDERVSICGATGDFRWNQENVPGGPCAPVPAGHRTSPTHSRKGGRDSSETRVRTAGRPAAVVG